MVDSSSRKCLNGNMQLMSEMSLPKKKHTSQGLKKREARNLAHDNCTRSWLLVWAGDVDAMDNGKNNFSELMKLVRSLEIRKYYYKIFFQQFLIG